MRRFQRAPRRGRTAAGVLVIDDVIVYERRGLKNLECGTECYDGTGVAHAARCSPAPVCTAGPEPLPSREGRGRMIEEYADDRVTATEGIVAGELVPAILDEDIEALGDVCDDVLKGRHAPSLGL